MDRCPHGEPYPLEIGDCCKAAQAAEDELAHLQPVIEAAIAWLESDDDDAEVVLVDILLAYCKGRRKEAGHRP